jgi:cytoskeletal protein RodZ
MSEISKQALKVDNNTSFPNNNTGYISPSILRAFNVNMIDSLVDEIGYTADSASWNVSIGQLNTYTSSFAPSLTQLNAFTASQLVVNSNLNQFTQSAGASITRLDTFSSSFNAYTASINQIRSNGVTLGNSTIFNLVGPGTFFSASLVQNIQGNIATLTFSSDSAKVNTSSFNDYTASAEASQAALSASLSASITALSSSTSASIAGINSFTASQNILNGTFATTGSNTFRGTETFEDAGGNATSLVPRSGSLILVAKGYTSASAHLTSSANSFVNLIFKDNSLTPDTIISGSNNIFANPAAPTTNFKRYIGANNIFISSGSVPQITGSTAYPLTINNNFSNGGTISIAGPISASTSTITNNILGQGGINVGSAGANNAEKLVGGFTIQSNVVMTGAPTIIANQNFITSSTTISNNQCVAAANIIISSSAMTVAGNLLNVATNNIRNAYWSSSIGLGNLTVARNIMQGSTHTILFTGSQPTGTTNAPQIAESQLMGSNITAFVDVSSSATTGTTANHSIISTMIQGHNTIVTGSSAAASNIFGSAFFGRYNAQDGNKSRTAQTVFAVGTGTSGGRKTGFLIDSASNAFVEGSLSVSGSSIANALNVTGSVDISGSTTLRGNLTQTTGSISAVGNIITTNGVFTSSVNGGLYIDNVGWVGSGSAGAFFINSNTQDIKIQCYVTESVNGKNIVIENFSPTGSATGIHGKVALRARGVGGAVTVENTSQFRVECQTEVTGAVYGNIIPLSINSNTASMNLTGSNFFTLELAAGSTTHLSATNIKPGQTINLLVSQPTGGTGSLSYNSTFDFPAGNAYIPTAVTSSKDILTFVTFDSSTIYATSINNLV